MRKLSNLFLCSFVMGLFLSAAASLGQTVIYAPPTLTFSTGYSNVQMERVSGLFYEHSGPYFDTDAAWSLPLVVPLQVGIGATGSGYFDRQSTTIPAAANNNYYYPYDHLYSDLSLFELEPRVGLYLGRRTGFFALPRLGAGLLIDDYAVDQTSTFDGNTYLSTRYHTGAAFEVRPAIQLGYCWGNISAGAEASYMYGIGDFGGFGHNAQEYRIGAFLKFSF